MFQKTLKSTLVAFAFISTVTAPASQAKELSAKEQVSNLQKTCTEASTSIQQRQKEKSLYLRLGGEQKIRTLVTFIYVKHKKNPVFKERLKDLESEPFIENVTMFLVSGSGGKEAYKGRTMKDAHSHLHITNADFLSAGSDVQSSMEYLGYGKNEIQEVVCALVHFIPDVVVE